MTKISFKATLFLLFMPLFFINQLDALILRFSLYIKKIPQSDGTYKLQRVFLCGDNHIIGTPENNLKQFYTFLEKLHNTPMQPTILVENQRLTSQWFNDSIDQQVASLMQQDLDYALKQSDPGKVTVLSLFGLAPKFFPSRYQPDIEKLSITNLECRHFLYYTAMLDYSVMKQNFSDTTLINKFKKLQEEKNKTLKLETIFSIPAIVDSYRNNSNDQQVQHIFFEIKKRLSKNIARLKEIWLTDFPQLAFNEPIAQLVHKHTTQKIELFNNHPVHYRQNSFIEKICLSLIASQFMDEMIEANALWNITRPNAPTHILVLTGSTHSGHFDLADIHINYNVAEQLEKIGYQLVTSFGLKNIFDVNQTWSHSVSTDLPRELFIWFSKTDKELIQTTA